MRPATGRVVVLPRGDFPPPAFQQPHRSARRLLVHPRSCRDTFHASASRVSITTVLVRSVQHYLRPNLHLEWTDSPSVVVRDLPQTAQVRRAISVAANTSHGRRPRGCRAISIAAVSAWPSRNISKKSAIGSAQFAIPAPPIINGSFSLRSLLRSGIPERSRTFRTLV